MKLNNLKKSHICIYGIKKDRECKKKPGPKSLHNKRKSRRVNSKRKSRRVNSKRKSRRVNSKCKNSKRKSKRVNSICKSRRVNSKRKSKRVNSKRNKRKSSKSNYIILSRCKKELQEKIKIIIREGKYIGKQAVAIAYSIISKKYPDCKKLFSRSK